MWIWVIIIAIIIGAIWGALTSKDGEKSEGAFAGAVTGGMGCGYVPLVTGQRTCTFIGA